MFDIGFSEILLIAVVAIIAIGPEDLPEALFRTGRFIRQVKLFFGGIRNEFSEIMHEAELQHYRKKLNESATIDAQADLAIIEHKEESHDAKPLPHDGN
jgi:sec-independent protein translocase protein TatB